MRLVPLLLAAAAVASCSTAPAPPAMRSAEAERQFQQILAGKVAQAPVSCLPSAIASDMRVIDENTVAFRLGANRVYVANMQGGCTNIGKGPYALVTKRIGSSLCRGDIAQVMDTTNGVTIGSCVFGDFTPYVRSRG